MSDTIVRGPYQVEIMADSIAKVPGNHTQPASHRLTTMRLVFPRIVLAEFNTHRLISRNSASSRAVPIAKMIKRAQSDPFIPDRFPLTHSGMQATEWVTNEMGGYDQLVAQWLEMRDQAVASVIQLDANRVSKQLANRLLEPFLMHEVIASATEWENFLSLRANAEAQNEIRIIAEMILQAMNLSTPTELKPGQWHLPFGNKLEADRLRQVAREDLPADEVARRVTVARCARVSYFNFEGKDDYQADLELYDRLTQSGHLSPFEHVARRMTPVEYMQYAHTVPGGLEHGWCGNFRGFIQLRKMFPPDVDNRPEPRLRNPH